MVPALACADACVHSFVSDVRVTQRMLMRLHTPAAAETALPDRCCCMRCVRLLLRVRRDAC